MQQKNIDIINLCDIIKSQNNKMLSRRKKVKRMTEKELMILSTFGKIIPKLSEVEKEKLLSFGEGIAFKTEELNKEKEKEHEKQPA